AARGGFGTRSGFCPFACRAGPATSREGAARHAARIHAALFRPSGGLHDSVPATPRVAAGQMTKSANENAAPGAAFSVVPAIRSVADAVVVVDRRLLAREGVELADGPGIVGPVAAQVRVIGLVLREHAAGVGSQGLVAQLGVGGDQHRDRVVLELALRI